MAPHAAAVSTAAASAIAASDAAAVSTAAEEEDDYPADIFQIVDFLVAIVPPLLGVVDTDLCSALGESHETLTAFASDTSAAGALLTVGVLATAGKPTIFVRQGDLRHDGKECSEQVAIIKTAAGPLLAREPLRRQLHVFSLSPDAVLDAAHACLRGAVAPLLRSAS
eukprot:2409919-Prymnesium_polylepis.1